MKKKVILVENISKKYTLGALKSLSLKDSFSQLFETNKSSHKPANSEFWALKNINFEVGEGEVFGVIGSNGAGKSTLLKILSRITQPTEGRVEIEGRVSSLLEVGTGFHPDLSGRENVFMNGVLLGMKRAEIRSKFDEIVEFSGIGKFIDTPVKRYSSGMYVRLAFAVAAHLEPEILIIDEVLAVGDAEFQKKCLGKMDSISKAGRTVLFVSHNMGAISELCGRTTLLNHGNIEYTGETSLAVAKYSEHSGKDNNEISLTPKADLPCQITKIGLFDAQQKPETEFPFGEPISIVINYSVKDTIRDFNFELNLFRNHHCVFTSFNTDSGGQDYVKPGEHEFVVQIPGKFLKAGKYYFNLALRRMSDGSHIQSLNKIQGFSIHEKLVNLAQIGYKEERTGDTVFPGEWKLTR